MTSPAVFLARLNPNLEALPNGLSMFLRRRQQTRRHISLAPAFLTMCSAGRDTGSNELDPSELGTKSYWDKYYQNDLDRGADGEDVPTEPSDLESWFDDVGAPAKVLSYLMSSDFPLRSGERGHDDPDTQGLMLSVLDLGTGNGSVLVSLAAEAEWRANMVGVDYSQTSILLARRLWDEFCATREGPAARAALASITFEVFNLLHDDPRKQTWWPQYDFKSNPSPGFDLVLDKGTFDAISLSSELITGQDGVQRKAFEVYPEKVADMVRPGGYFLITSCNWTEEEAIHRFAGTGDMHKCFEVFHKIKYPVYQFGGQQGQGVASICFKRRE